MTGWSTTAAASRGARASRWRPSSRCARSSASATRTSPCRTSGSSWARCTASKSRTRGREAGPAGGRARGQESGGRGPYRRRRERRPLCGMMVHLDASRHGWLPQLPMQDLVVGYGRCRRADPVRALCARGEHGLDVGRTQTPPAHVWALCGALHRSRQSLLLHAQGGDGPHHRAWRGRQPGAEGAGDPPGPLAAGAAGGGEWELRARQHLPRAGLCARLQPALHGAPGAARPGLPAAGGSRSGVAALRTARPHGAKRQPGELQEPGAPTCRAPARGRTTCAARSPCTSFPRADWGSATRGGCWAATRPTGNCSTCRQPRAPSGENPHDLVQRETRVVLVASFLGYPRASPRRRWPENGAARASPLALRARCVSLAYHHPVPPANRRCPVQPERTSLTANDPDLCTCQ